ncbi:PaaX family transcriptional regulator [Actinocatenispora sera]|uniref:PaaX family transcriptional regulator n=1 Tax=Actinocatenispora sera TaxID=390989 RepID=A0A810LA98_9ACTN|nr:PaaX family transcriptional regulator C-terminal domain-containing protein [Actinocatenispora sera]BCJ32203.1 PaaX family transcriptional regulator [Actinocatenispora sera]
MSRSDPPTTTSRTRISRTLLVSFLGAVVRRRDDWMPIAGVVELMRQAGQDAPGVRTAVFRLKQRGWLESQSRAGARGYALTDRASAVLAQGDEVIWHSRRPADLADGWCIVNLSIPEAERRKRDQLRTHLAHLGFGNVGTAMWLAPARMRAAAEGAIGELGMDKYAAVFVGAYVGSRDLTSLLYESWDLAAIDDSYRAFIDDHERLVAELESRPAVDPEQAFVHYLRVVDTWRQLPFRDPGLPRELLAADWSGPAAVDRFERLVALLEGPALAHAARYWP